MERDFGMQMEKQIEIKEPGQIQIQEQLLKKKKPDDRNLQAEPEFFDEVYVFFDKNKPGFKFYDRSPKLGSQEAMLVGVPPEGVYYTYGIEDAEWDEEINRPAETVPVKYMDGTNTVTTVMVTEEEYYKILKTIEEEEKKRSYDGKICIDLRQREKGYNFNDVVKKAINNIDLETLKKFENNDNKNIIKEKNNNIEDLY